MKEKLRSCAASALLAVVRAAPSANAAAARCSPTPQANLQSGVGGWTGDFYSAGRFPQPGGGLRYAFRGDNTTDPPSAELVAAELLVDGAWRPLQEVQGPITLLTSDYIAKGGDFYNFTGGESLLFDSSRPLDEMMAAVWPGMSPVAYPKDGRVADCAKAPAAPLCTGRYGAAPTQAPMLAAAAPAPAPAQAQRSRKLLRQ